MNKLVFKPKFEILEDKIAPSVSFNGDTVYVTGTHGNDIIVIEETKDSYLLNGKFLASKELYNRVVIDVKTGNDVVLIETLGPNVPLVTSIIDYQPLNNGNSGGIIAGASVGNKYSQKQFEELKRQQNGDYIYYQYFALNSPMYYGPDDITLPAGGLPYLVTDVAYVANYPLNDPNDPMYQNLMRVANFNGRPNFLNEAKFLVLASTEVQTSGMLWVTYGSMDYSQLNDQEQLDDMREYVDRLFEQLSQYGFNSNQRTILANKVLGYDTGLESLNNSDNGPTVQNRNVNTDNTKQKVQNKQNVNKTNVNKNNKAANNKKVSVRKR